MTKNMLSIAALGAICCLILPAQANAWSVGERGDAGSVFLHDEPLEGVYGNNWWGTAVSAAEAGEIKVYISGEGKTVDFDGMVSLNCESISGFYWKTASNFDTPVKKTQMTEIMPGQVLQNARKIFCK